MQLSTLTAVMDVTFMCTLLISITLPQTNGLRCHTCVYNKGDMDDLCLTDPVALNRITDCNKKYCTIVRQESVKPREVVSFSRSCEDVPVFLDKVVKEWTFMTYFRSCTNELCNDSDGVIPMASKDPNAGSANNTIIKGKNSAAKFTQLSVSLLVIISILMLLF